MEIQLLLPFVSMYFSYISVNEIQNNALWMTINIGGMGHLVLRSAPTAWPCLHREPFGC